LIDAKRLERRMTELARIGGSGTAVSRLGLSADEQRARDLVGAWLTAKGAEVRRDGAANLFARFGREGEAILVGSHLDSVPDGGRFDGALGVLCAVEAVESLVDTKVRLRRPIEVVAWADEEGARFGVGLFGSTATFGRLTQGVADRRDRDGVSIGDALRALGEKGDPATARRDPKELAAYLELHIEQGPFLEEEGLAIGVVEGIVAISWSRLTIHGVQDHAGPTPMRIRHDALVAASSVVTGVRGIAREIGGELVTTVGNLTVSPNIVNAIPGKVTLSIDMRDPQDATLDRALPMLDRVVREACEREGVRYELEHYWRVPRTPFDREVVAAVERAAQATGAGHRRILSGAGHDAQYMAAIGPAGMVFVPSRGGRSHCEEEFTGMDDIEHGANTLLGTALELAVTL